MFQHIEKRHVENAAKNVRQFIRGISPEVKERLSKVSNFFHEDKSWEVACARWEEIIINAILADADEDNTNLHANVMGILSLMFAIGFDSGLQYAADSEVEKLLKESNGKHSS